MFVVHFRAEDNAASFEMKSIIGWDAVVDVGVVGVEVVELQLK
jgi:hypothetical protein